MTRSGVSMMAGALASELLVSLVQHTWRWVEGGGDGWWEGEVGGGRGDGWREGEMGGGRGRWVEGGGDGWSETY